jgi:hypothetical protein
MFSDIGAVLRFVPFVYHPTPYLLL